MEKKIAVIAGANPGMGLETGCGNLGLPRHLAR